MKQKLFITFGLWILLTVPTLANGTTIDEIFNANFGDAVGSFGQYTGLEMTDTAVCDPGNGPACGWQLTVVSRVFYDAAPTSAHLTGTYYYFYQITHTLPDGIALNAFTLFDFANNFDDLLANPGSFGYLAGGDNPMASVLAQMGFPVGLRFHVVITNEAGDPALAAIWIASGNQPFAGAYAFEGANGVITEMGSAYLPSDQGGGLSFDVPEPSSFVFLAFALIAGSFVSCRMRTGPGKSRT